MHLVLDMHLIIGMVLDTNNLHFSEELFEFPAQADMYICLDALGFSARCRAEESRQEFCADSCENDESHL